MTEKKAKKASRSRRGTGAKKTAEPVSAKEDKKVAAVVEEDEAKNVADTATGKVEESEEKND